MKTFRLLILSSVCVCAFSGCAGLGGAGQNPLAATLASSPAIGTPLASVGRLFPDGSSGEMLKPSLVGLGFSLTAERIAWTGTNGYPCPTGYTPVNGTNGAVSLSTYSVPVINGKVAPGFAPAPSQ